LAEVTALFFDVGGVLLSNGWDRAERTAASERFHLDWKEFEDRHELVLHAFETGEMGLDEYLDRVIFYCPRSFSREEFADYIRAQSKELPGTMDVLRRLAATKMYLLCTLNNESRDMNAYRIQKFGLRRCFDVFLSSCYLGVRKPDEAIYRRALDITQRKGEECLFIDDRALNLECAAELGMRTIQFKDAAQLERELKGLNIAIAVA
jgi:putative hydrolase of the HAD superfamily